MGLLVASKMSDADPPVLQLGLKSCNEEGRLTGMQDNPYFMAAHTCCLLDSFLAIEKVRVAACVAKKSAKPPAVPAKKRKRCVGDAPIAGSEADAQDTTCERHPWHSSVAPQFPVHPPETPADPCRTKGVFTFDETEYDKEAVEAFAAAAEALDQCTQAQGEDAHVKFSDWRAVDACSKVLDWAEGTEECSQDEDSSDEPETHEFHVRQKSPHRAKPETGCAAGETGAESDQCSDAEAGDFVPSKDTTQVCMSPVSGSHVPQHTVREAHVLRLNEEQHMLCRTLS